jgi:threonine/homoserine/homoserine lactone efflux protein
VLSIAANPKAAVFAVSFFPQFLPRHGPLLATVIVLATIQVILDSAWCAGIVLAADRARHWLSRGRIRQRIERVLGAVLIALGIELAIDTR